MEMVFTIGSKSVKFSTALGSEAKCECCGQSTLKLKYVVETTAIGAGSKFTDHDKEKALENFDMHRRIMMQEAGIKDEGFRCMGSGVGKYVSNGPVSVSFGDSQGSGGAFPNGGGGGVGGGSGKTWLNGTFNKTEPKFPYRAIGVVAEVNGNKATVLSIDGEKFRSGVCMGTYIWVCDSATYGGGGK